jgi:AcrR family transcriptional regulator
MSERVSELDQKSDVGTGVRVMAKDETTLVGGRSAKGARGTADEVALGVGRMGVGTRRSRHFVPSVAHDGHNETMASAPNSPPRTRMTGKERREQLLEIGRSLFAERGFDATSVEEIAAKAGVSKPVVYEHFGGKEGLYAVVVDREMRTLLEMVTSALTGGHPRELLEQAAFALLDYVENYSDGFRILVRDSPVAASTGNFASLISDIATQVEGIMATEFRRRGYDPAFGAMYSQMLVGMVALTGQWWLDAQSPTKDEVAAHMVNLAWNGLSGLEHEPRLMTRRGFRARKAREAAKAARKTAVASAAASVEDGATSGGAQS